MACDICGDNKASELTVLVQTYQTDEIKQICPACREICDKQLIRIRGVIGPLLRRFMTNLREEKYKCRC